MVHAHSRKYAYLQGVNSVKDSDAYSEGLMILVKAKNDFDENNGAKFSTYLWHCLTRGLWRWWQKQVTSNQKFSKGFEPLDQTEARPYDSDVIEKLRVAVDLFPVGSISRVVFQMRLEGKSFVEISEALGQSKQSVHQRWWNGKILPVLRDAFFTIEEKC